MQLKDLKRTMRQLVTLEPTSDPVISCYINLERGATAFRDPMDDRIRDLRRTLSGRPRASFEGALGQIESFLATTILPDARGAAIFARGGESTFFVPLQFRVPLPDWFAVHSTPNVYHLVELKDTYHRYVVVLVTRAEARILEINLGAVTEQVWREAQDPAERIGDRMTREHYRHRRAAQTEQFLREKVKVVDRLISQGGHTHLILAGDPEMTQHLRSVLPKHLEAKVADTIATPRDSKEADVVLASIAAFVEHEEKESRAVVDRLCRELETGGLTITGEEKVLKALAWEQVDVLVLAKDYRPSAGWACPNCGVVVARTSAPKACADCGGSEVRATNLREEMARVAERNGCLVEVVAQSEQLMKLGGVGALLRYRTL